MATGFLLVGLPLPAYQAADLQQLLHAEEMAKNSGDPTKVGVAAQRLTDEALREMQEVHSALKDPHLTPTQHKQLGAREQQLREVISTGFNDWGTAEARQQRYQEALQHFEEAETWDPAVPGLLRNLGVAAFRLENYSKAMSALTQVTKTDPGDQTARLMLAMSLFSLEKFSDAASQFSLIPDLTLQDTRTAYAWAFSLARTGQQSRASQIADTLSARDLEPGIRFLVCQLYTTAENYAQAVPCFRRISAENPAMPRVHYETGATLIRLGHPSDAIPELREELKINPNDPDTEYDLAYALLETAQRDEALTLLEKVVAQKPDYFQAQYELGKTLLENNRVPEAIEHLEAAEKLDPSADYIHYQLQSAYRRSGRTEDANRELAIYKQIKASQRNSGPAHETSGP